MSNMIKDAIIGLAVGDALGVPVEFSDRKSLKLNPVKDMRAYGTYNLPKGIWSDDTSMTLALVDSLITGLDYQDIINNFSKWFYHGKYSAFGEVFDIGNTTRQALYRYSQGTAPLKCGGYKDYDNGNGSLMRILPVLFYLQTNFGDDFQNYRQAFEIIHNISSLTHGHKRSQIACGIYISVASRLNIDDKLECAVSQGIKKAIDFYRQDITYQKELPHFQRLEMSNFKDLDEAEINSGGYVVDTLEAALWCLLNTDNYQACVLKAVNLGKDTDTTAAVVGGLAGLKYGYGNICKKWLQVLAKKSYIENLSNQLYKSLNTNISK